MRLLTLALAFGLLFAPLSARADVVVLADPDQWMEQAVKDIGAGRTDEFARNYATLVDNPEAFDSLSSGLKVLSELGSPVFVEKAVDKSYGQILREVIYVALYGQVDYMYFRFTVKKGRDNGWIISNFEFKHAAADLFPKDFVTAK